MGVGRRHARTELICATGPTAGAKAEWMETIRTTDESVLIRSRTAINPGVCIASRLPKRQPGLGAMERGFADGL